MTKDSFFCTALKRDPAGATCSFCHKPNDNWDESGWFYLWVNPDKSALEDGQAACQACCQGTPGQQHEAIHGKENGKRND